MSSYTIEIDDFSDDDYWLIGIHTVLEDYRLAYFLNKVLEIHLKRASYNLDFKHKNDKASYSVFEYSNKELDYTLYLLSNVYKSTDREGLLNFGIFEDVENTFYLIPEEKKIDYFIKIEGEINDVFVDEILQQFKKISQIFTSYTIELNTLKSKEFLIF